MFNILKQFFVIKSLSNKDFEELTQFELKRDKKESFSYLNKKIKEMYDERKNYVLYDLSYNNEICSLLKTECINRNFKILEIPTKNNHFIIYR